MILWREKSLFVYDNQQNQTEQSRNDARDSLSFDSGQTIAQAHSHIPVNHILMRVSQCIAIIVEALTEATNLQALWYGVIW